MYHSHISATFNPTVDKQIILTDAKILVLRGSLDSSTRGRLLDSGFGLVD